MLVKYDLESTDEIQVDLGDISHLDCSRKPDDTFEVCIVSTNLTFYDYDKFLRFEKRELLHKS